MELVVVLRQVTPEPFVGPVLGFRLMEVVKGFMRLLNSPEWALNLALGASRGTDAILASGGMRLPVNM